MDEISWSRPRVSLSKTHITCVVCGLRSGALICEHCTAQPEASIAWLETLPSLSPSQQQALLQLRKTQPATDNYYDGEWRPITRTDDATLYLLRRRGFEIGADEGGRLMARWPIAPAAPEGITIRHSHGRYYATDGRRFGAWAVTEREALAKWTY